MTDYDRYQNVYNGLKEILNDNRFESFDINYTDRERFSSLTEKFVYVELNDEYMGKIDQFTIEDFHYVKPLKVFVTSVIPTQYGEKTGLHIEFSEPSYENLYEYIALLEQDERVKRAHTFSYSRVIHD